MKKLDKLQDSVASIFKGNSANGNIRFTNIVDTMKHVNDAMKELGLYAVDTIEPIDGTPLITPMIRTARNGNETQMFLGTAKYSIKIVDSENGDSETFSMVGSAWMDNPSASFGSIATYNARYLWSKILRVAFTTEKEVEQQIIPEVKLATPKQVEFLETLIVQKGRVKLAVLTKLKVKSLSELSIETISETIEKFKELENGTPLYNGSEHNN